MAYLRNTFVLSQITPDSASVKFWRDVVQSQGKDIQVHQDPGVKAR